MLSLIPRSLIEKISKKHNANRYCKHFMSYDHLVTMLYSCFFNAGNLREVTTGIQAFGLNKLNHLGLNYFPRRSTLSDANRRRPAQFFADLYHSLYNMYFVLPDSRTKLNREEDIFIIDSTTISLFTSVMRGAGTSKANGKKKGGVKAHVLMNAQHDLPAFVFISEAKEHDLIFLRQLKVPNDSTVLFDKAYINYTQFIEWGNCGIRWVSRLKRDASIKILWIYLLVKNPTIQVSERIDM
ncbi:MAG: transposase [Bacteroidetes bacterium]|nr:transposase [Bacteroidota bacterium]